MRKLLIPMLLIPALAFAAIDSAAKRENIATNLPPPDGSIGSGDRATLDFVYRGIGTWADTSGGSTPGIGSTQTPLILRYWRHRG